ncbi:major facilitator superfamily domain-containing protein 1 [Patella vulgata]|uniref:major facilitator superfamily domain-containing protein 1 n=1 Tax=Patella vulgata TaxID=6465 RepID=UPI0024A8B5CE|nr:major facilitator superfamily domain-containing protein 1 [Patella vulgata]
MAELLADTCGFRFLVLFFNCMLTFGSYFCFDMPSVLQDTFTQRNNCTNDSKSFHDDKTFDSSLYGNASSPNVTCNNCTECLGMSEDNYNLLYAIYAWTNAVVVIAAGFLIDKLGNRFGVFLFSFLCVVGSSTFAVGVMMKGTAAMLPLMLIGRLIFGSGNGSLTIVQNRITAYWFRNKELAMAFGITLAFSRLGSVLNFFLTQNFAQVYGLQWTMWGGAMLCGIGFVSAIVVSSLDKWGTKQKGDDETLRSDSKKLKFTDIRYFTLPFWLLVLAIMFFYNGVFPFVADASKFIKDKYDLPKTTSAYLAGAVYDVSMVVSPFLGGLIDVIGKRGILALICALLTIPVFGILAFTSVYPLVATLWLGITYSFAAASLWPSIPLVVSQATVGTAMGVTTSVQMIGIGISNLVVGEILGKNLTAVERLTRWKYVMIFLLGNTLACVATTLLMNITDKKRGGILNLSRKQKLQKLHDVTESFNSESGTYDTDSERQPILGARHRSINA